MIIWVQTALLMGTPVFLTALFLLPNVLVLKMPRIIAAKQLGLFILIQTLKAVKSST